MCSICKDTLKEYMTGNNHLDVTQKSSMNQHIASLHEENKKFKCVYRSAWKSELKNHIQSVHEGIIKKINCEVCDYRSF